MTHIDSNPKESLIQVHQNQQKHIILGDPLLTEIQDVVRNSWVKLRSKAGSLSSNPVSFGRSSKQEIAAQWRERSSWSRSSIDCWCGMWSSSWTTVTGGKWILKRLERLGTGARMSFKRTSNGEVHSRHTDCYHLWKRSGEDL